MSAMEKACWWELAVVLVTLLAVAILVPWFGNAASGAFGLLGFLAAAMFFVRHRRDRVVVDERDQEIERRATNLGVHMAWMFLFLGIILLILMNGNGDAVPKHILNWMIWGQFALCYLVKSLTGVYFYRRDCHAA